MTLVSQVSGAATAVDEAVAAPSVNRMAIALLALVGIVIAIYMSLYKLGVMPTVACGTGSCEVVQNSPWAVFAGIPVPFIGVVGYGSIFLLAMAGIRPRYAPDPRIAAALLVLSFTAVVFSTWLSYVEAVLIEAWCRWCIGSAVIASLLFLFALPEIPRLRSRKDAS